jgi:hypothetical protein
MKTQFLTLLSQIHSFWYRLTFSLRNKKQPYEMLSEGRIIRSWCPRHSGIHGDEINTRGKELFRYGTFHFLLKAKAIFNSHGNICPWLLQLDQGKVQEIDVVEFMHGKMYFTTWVNEKSSNYFKLLKHELSPDLKEFKTKYKRRQAWIKQTHTWSVDLRPNRIKWYIDGAPIAVSYVNIPTQEMYAVVTGLEKGIFLRANYVEYRP